MRFLLETKDSVNTWAAEVGHDIAGVESLVDWAKKDWKHAFSLIEDQDYLDCWLYDMRNLVSRNEFADGMMCSIEIDGCIFAFSNISDTKH